MKEICVDVRMLMAGGIGTYIKNLLLRMNSSSYKWKLIADPSHFVQFEWLNAFEVIPLEAPIYSIEEQLKLPFIIPKCDLFWSPHFNVPIFPIRARRRLVTIHDVYHLAFFSSLKIFEKAYARFVIDRAISLSHQIITDSEFSYSEMRKHTKVNTKKVSVIPLGIDHPFFSAPQDQKTIDFVKERYRLPEKFILFVGNVKPHKNLKGLIKAFQIMLKAGLCDYQLLIVGKKEGFIRSDHLETILEEDELLKSHVKLLGFVEDEDLPILYQLTSVFVLPSLYEGFGLPVLEAMSAGCPVVASKAASLPEVCGNAAEFVDPNNPQDIARGITDVIKNETKRNSLREKGLKRVKEFQWEKTAQKHLEIIDGLCQ